MHTKTIIQTNAAPAATGPYAQAVGYGGLLFVSAQVAIDPHTGGLLDADVAAQTRQVMLNLRAILHAAGLDLSHALRARVSLKNMSDLRAVDGAYGEFFDENPPARSVAEVNRLPEDALVSVELVAAAPQPVPPEEALAPEERGERQGEAAEAEEVEEAPGPVAADEHAIPPPAYDEEETGA